MVVNIPIKSIHAKWPPGRVIVFSTNSCTNESYEIKAMKVSPMEVVPMAMAGIM